MINANDYSLLVNSTDSFEDCWIPFFTLFRKYWPDFYGHIYLNTEKKSFLFEGLSIVSIQNNLNESKHKSSWSECLSHALDIIPDSIVLYMQEDYFLHDFVKNDLINEFATLISTTGIDCINLTDQATPGPFTKSNHKGLLEIDKKAPYRISTQAALWRKDVLKQYIRKYESAWQFEHFATKRARILKHNLFNVDTNIYKKHQNEIIPYVFTGVIRGKWNEEVEDIFKRNGIDLDFTKRGFYNLENNKKLKKTIVSNFKILITILRSKLDLLKLKICRN